MSSYPGRPGPNQYPEVPEGPQFITFVEAARRLSVTQKTLRNWVSAGILPAYRIGRSALRLKPEDVDALITRVPTTAAGR